jgi:hypothetical protein
MTVVGFDLSKILVEKNKPGIGKIDIANNVSITDVKEAKLNIGDVKKNGLEFTFQYLSEYKPDVAKIEIIGKVVDFEKEEKTKSILEIWKKDKKLPKEILGPIYNSILGKCNVEAIILSRDIQLPPPIPMPKIKQE